MPGTSTNAFPVRHIFTGYSSAAVTASLVLSEMVVPFDGQIRAVKVLGVTAGTGAGNTVVDLQKNGVTMYSTAANRPTLAAASTGEFANATPDIKSVQKGDRLTWIVSSISTTGHARLMASAALELA